MGSSRQAVHKHRDQKRQFRLSVGDRVMKIEPASSVEWRHPGDSPATAYDASSSTFHKIKSLPVRGLDPTCPRYARTADTMLDEEKTRAEVESRMQARNALKFSTQRQLSTKRRQELQEKKALFADMVERMEAQQKSAVQIQAAFRAYKARQEYLKEKKLKSLWEAVNAMDEKAKREQLAEEERLNRIKMNELAKQQKASDNKLSRPKTSHEYQVGRKQQFDSLSPPASRHLDRRFQDGRLNCDQACAGDDSKSARAKPPFMGNGHRVRFGKDALDTCYGLSASSARIASRLDSPVLIPCTNRDKGSSTRGEMNSPNQRELSAFEEYLHKGPENDSTNVGSLKPSIKLYIPDEVLEHLRPKSPQVPRTSSPPRTHLIPRPKTSGPSMTPTKAGFRLPAPLDVKNPMHGVLRLKNESPPERKSSPPQESSEKTALKSKNVGSAVVSKNVGSAVVNIPSGPGFPLHEYQSETVNDAVLRLGKESKHSRDKGDTANQLDLLLEKKNEKAAQPLKARYLMLERSV
ncbi:hypothetical protein BSKO_00164 [Bryopsis sp. KO-2023]|nr:hypothetical protein BSKO_00164 [Bryopsis sp. KO-2023]